MNTVDQNHIFKRCIGLTGGIASGKSTVEKIFNDYGFFILDADQIAKKCFSDPQIETQILSIFGSLDRSLIKDVIFNDREKKKNLEQILHPEIRKQSLALLSQHFLSKTDDPLPAVYSAALIVETDLKLLIPRILTIETLPEIQLNRLIKRDQLSEDLAKKILENQASSEQRKRVSTWVIENNGSIDELTQKVKDFICTHFEVA